jgi:hypothetical protein
MNFLLLSQKYDQLADFLFIHKNRNFPLVNSNL